MKEWTGDNTDEFVVMSRQEVRDFDAWAIQQIRIPGVVLMENAGRSCADQTLKILNESGGSRVCVFCGAGNNGGDGFVIARHLFNRGIEVRIAIFSDPEKISGDARINYDICRDMNLAIEMLDLSSELAPKEIERLVLDCDMLVDAVFGTGLRGELRSEYALLISCLNAHNLPIVAVDIPSGLDCDTGLPLPVCIEAAATVTFAALKQGFAVNAKSRTATGRVFVADIGITPTSRQP